MNTSSATNDQQSSPIVTNSNPPNDSNSTSAIISFNGGSQLCLKLSGSANYPAWHVQFNALLLGYGLKGFVDSTHPCPPKHLDAAATIINPAHDRWVRQDQLLIHALVSSMEPTLTTMLGGVKTSKDAWQILSTMFASRSRSRILSLKEKLSHLTKGDHSVSEYLQQIKSVSDELSIIYQPLDNTDLVLYTLNGLGTEFREVAAAIRARETPIMFEELHD